MLIRVTPSDRSLYSLSDRWTTPHGKVVQAVRHERGGHFAAYEVPESLVGDLRKMFGKDGPAYHVVGGKDGY